MMVIEHQLLTAQESQPANVGLPVSMRVDCTLVQPGSFVSQSDLVASTYEAAVSGHARVISRTHLYLSDEGRDLYPTVEQFEQLQRGERVTLALSQWA